MNENGYCPNCGLDFDGGSIWEHFYNEFQTEGDWLDLDGEYNNGERTILDPERAAIRADKVAKNYGATRTKGKWGKVIGISCREKDRIVAWKCPDCNHEWTRK